MTQMCTYILTDPRPQHYSLQTYVMHDLLALHFHCGPSKVSMIPHLSVSTPPLISHWTICTSTTLFWRRLLIPCLCVSIQILSLITDVDPYYHSVLISHLDHVISSMYAWVQLWHSSTIAYHCPNWFFQCCCLLPTDHIFFWAALPFKHNQLALHLHCGPFKSLVCCT